MITHQSPSLFGVKTMGHLGQSVAGSGRDPLLVCVIVDHDTGPGRRDALLRPLVTGRKNIILLCRCRRGHLYQSVLRICSRIKDEKQAGMWEPDEDKSWCQHNGGTASLMVSGLNPTTDLFCIHTFHRFTDCLKMLRGQFCPERQDLCPGIFLIWRCCQVF